MRGPVMMTLAPFEILERAHIIIMNGMQATQKLAPFLQDRHQLLHSQTR
jgi:hypothetical protein